MHTDQAVVTMVPSPKPKPVTREKLLEEKLRAMHCRPILKLFKIMSQEVFRAEIGDGDADQLKAYVEGVRAQLDKIDPNKDLASQLKFGSQDD